MKLSYLFTDTVKRGCGQLCYMITVHLIICSHYSKRLKGVSLQRNSGAALVGEYNRVF